MMETTFYSIIVNHHYSHYHYREGTPLIYTFNIYFMLSLSAAFGLGIEKVHICEHKCLRELLRDVALLYKS